MEVRTSQVPIPIDKGLNVLNKTIEDTRKFMFPNKLCLNDSKTEFIVFRLNRYLKKMPKSSIKIRDETIRSVKIVNNLGFLLDMQLGVKTHISTWSKCAVFTKGGHCMSGVL